MASALLSINIIGMMRIKSAFLCLFLLCGTVYAQSIEDIRESDEYLCGEGWGESLKAADNAALQDLISQISIPSQSSPAVRLLIPTAIPDGNMW